LLESALGEFELIVSVITLEGLLILPAGGEGSDRHCSNSQPQDESFKHQLFIISESLNSHRNTPYLFAVETDRVFQVAKLAIFSQTANADNEKFRFIQTISRRFPNFQPRQPLVVTLFYKQIFVFAGF
jgi:hypothetical protein